VYDGRRRELQVAPPRVSGEDAEVVVDGRLDEPAWRRAVVLTGFSQFSPVDGVAAQDSTEVLVWYSPTAIHFGVRAFEAHGAPHATLAQRDHVLDADDNVQLLLGTFHDARRAVLLAVNPLGVQADGTLRETFLEPNASWWQRPAARQPADLSPDFVFESSGRVTDYGYEVEIRVPFKSLTFQQRATQSWGLNVVRHVQHSGYEDSWAPARRSAVSFLAQSGTLDGLRDLHRGLVLDVTPEVTQRTLGARSAPGGWRYDAESPRAGGTARWRVTNNATLDATVRPDFSQVESDAGQLVTDPRAALFFPEKRPFFLDNLDAFDTPSNLVYTRTIVQPRAAAKLAGTFARTNVALLSAVDDRGDGEGHAPVVTVLRVQRDVGALSRVGMTYTGVERGASSNRVADVDGALALGRSVALSGQLAASRTDDGARAVGAPLWGAGLTRTGAHVGVNYRITGMDPDFHTAAGFVARPGLVASTFGHHFTYLGAPGRFVESASFDPTYISNWKYDRFSRGGDALEKKVQLITRYQLRGGWSTVLSLLVEQFGYDPDLFRDTYVERTTAGRVDTVPFPKAGRLPNRDYVVALNSPQWKWLGFNGVLLWGQDDNFEEWSSARPIYSTLDVLIHPTERLRVMPTFDYLSVRRKTTGETVKTERVVRVKTEYQIARPLFVRVTGELDGLDLLPLRDDSRTNGPLLFRDADGTFRRSARTLDRTFRGQWLVAWQPGPGTVLFAGYDDTSAPVGTSLSSFVGQRYRRADAFFVKASYLWRY
jgi:hypothetical protein